VGPLWIWKERKKLVNLICSKAFFYPRAGGTKRRARVLIPHGELYPGMWKHSGVKSCPPFCLCHERFSTLFACASTSSVEGIVFHFERTYFAVLQQFFVLNFVVIKSLQKYNTVFFFSILTGNKPAVSWISGCSTVKQSLNNNCFHVLMLMSLII
jgi:hypothetical protein